MKRQYKKAVLIGRFEPFHNGHMRNIANALEVADTVHILIGSSYEPRTIKNPFTCTERESMIDSAIRLAGFDTSRFKYSFIRDYCYNDTLWVNAIQSAVQSIDPVDNSEIAILGYEKDDSSWYLRAFPKWAFKDTGGFVEHGSVTIDATKIRELYFEGHLDYIKGAVPASVFTDLKKFTLTEAYDTLVDEFEFIKAYKSAWAAAPYPPTFFTVDTVVIQGGHILLVKRKFAPGKGLWALPGGFLNQKETARTACIRELREETELKVPVPVLNGSITFEKLFDKPDRSLRGRTITQAFLIELNGGDAQLPRVKGVAQGNSDEECDAELAKWFPISEVLDMSEQLFDDHYSIIQSMIGHAR